MINALSNSGILIHGDGFRFDQRTQLWSMAKLILRFHQCNEFSVRLRRAAKPLNVFPLVEFKERLYGDSAGEGVR
ncbi:hypothetical protein BBJ41_31535 [Burkholderia stabilis]|nr:hypothetical protein BBJ41_31535 [Burkholderia stabilis]